MLVSFRSCSMHKIASILAILNVMVLSGCETPSASQASYEDLVLKYGIEEEPCITTIPDDDICEIRIEAQGEIDGLYDLAVREGVKDDYYISHSDDILTIITLGDTYASFVCCDIQGPFRALETTRGDIVSAAKFRIPAAASLEITLLSNPDVIGPTRIYNELDPYQEAYFEGLDNAVEYTKLDIKGFSREIYLYTLRPEEKIEYVFYIKDGYTAVTFASALRAYLNRFIGAQDLPNVAFVGIESGNNETRSSEYLKYWDQSESSYDRYQTTFREIIVPEIEKRLDFTRGAEGRVIVGKSSGGAWALSSSIGYPNFACNYIVLSPPGKVPPHDELAILEGHKCVKIYLGAGVYEDAFTEDAESIAQKFGEFDINFKSLLQNSGHSDLTWAPLFVRFFEDIIMSDD